METGAHPAALPWRVINSITSWAGAGYRRRVSIPRNARNEAGCVPLSHRHHGTQSPADHAPTSAVVGRRWEPSPKEAQSDARIRERKSGRPKWERIVSSRRLLEGRELSLGGADLSARQPTAPGGLET